MKILRLDLIAFGPFTGQSIVFEASRGGLHIVYGPNEAGKSSALRALRHWLYGIPHTSSDNFVHPHKNLRIGGELQDAHGRRLRCIRRKGRDKTLRGPDDIEVLDESHLARMLGGVDEDAFHRRFGIDYEGLRRGGQEIAEGRGELGAILFAAGAGIVDIRKVLDRFESELQNLFRPKGKNASINAALDALKELREQIKAAQLPTAKWILHDQGLRACQSRLSEIERELIENRLRKDRLERMRKALPLLRARERLDKQRATVADAPLLPDDFSAIRGEVFAKLASAQQTEREAAMEIEKLESAMSGVTIPTRLLEHRTAVAQVHSEWGSIQKAGNDRPRLVAEQQQAEERAREILLELERAPDLQRADSLRLTRRQRQQIQSLAGDCKACVEREAAAQRVVGRLSAEIRFAEACLGQLAAPRDTRVLSLAVDKARQHGDLDRQQSTVDAELRQLETNAQVELNKLPLFNGTLEELEMLPVCSAETIDRFDKELADAQAAIDKLVERMQQRVDRIQMIHGELESLRLEYDVPTEEDLRSARRRRDEGWRLVRRAWRDGVEIGEPDVAAFIEQFAPGANLDRAFAASVEAADALADRLRGQADRVAQKASLTANRQKEQRQLFADQERLASAERCKDDLLAQWREEWSSLGIDPLSPREMQAWRRRQKELADTAKAIRKQRETANGLRRLIESLRDELVQALATYGAAPPSETSSLADVMEHGAAIVQEIEAANRRRIACEQKLAELRDQLDGAQAAARRAEADLRQWRADWAAAVELLHLEPDASPDDANATIQLMDELMEQTKTAEGLRRRIEGIDADADEFRQSARRLLAEVAPDLLETPIAQAVADLHDRLQAAAKSQARLEEWSERLVAEKSKHDQAQAAAEQLQTMIRSMCVQANCASLDELPDAEARSAERRAIETELRSVNDQLELLAAEEPFEDFLADVQSLDLHQCEAELQSLAHAIADLEAARTEVADARGGHRTELARMDGNARAAEAQEKVELQLAAIRADAEQYIRLRLAKSVLQLSIERFREASQGPVLARAGEWFAEMTLGSFSGLRADYDDKGKATLLGVRADGGQTVSVDAMSDGTCDQLFLALRLALLEAHLDNHGPLPLIADDILIKFDDERAVAALRILSRIALRTQVVYFTHHEHLLELARNHLDDGRFFTYRLDGSPNPVEPHGAAGTG